MMDSTARDVLIVALERLQQLEKDRLEDKAFLTASVRLIRSLTPTLRKAFDQEVDLAKRSEAADRVASLTPIYVGLIDMLKDRDQTETTEQERIRRLLEDYQGPKQ
jgi:hypothetical protein